MLNSFKWPIYNTKLSSQIKYIADNKIVNMRQFYPKFIMTQRQLLKVKEFFYKL